MGSISGLKSILLLVDLCTCRISAKTKIENDLLSEIFGLYSRKSTSFMAPLPGIS